MTQLTTTEIWSIREAARQQCVPCYWADYNPLAETVVLLCDELLDAKKSDGQPDMDAATERGS